MVFEFAYFKGLEYVRKFVMYFIYETDNEGFISFDKYRSLHQIGNSE